MNPCPISERSPSLFVGPTSLQWRQRMNLKLFTAAAVLTTAIAAPALAQDPAARAPVVRQYHRGFWPGEVAAGVVGGAIGTAGAIATAPFRGGAYDANAYYAGPDEVYDYRSTCG